MQAIVHYWAPEERASFVFAEEPRTYYELQMLCEKVQSFKFAESARETTLAPSLERRMNYLLQAHLLLVIENSVLKDTRKKTR